MLIKKKKKKSRRPCDINNIVRDFKGHNQTIRSVSTTFYAAIHIIYQFFSFSFSYKKNTYIHIYTMVVARVAKPSSRFWVLCP